MDYSIYIIKQNTPESRLLHRAGINRKNLPVSKWKGRKRRHGGFGKSPIEWRLTGVENIERLCLVIINTLGVRKKPLSKEEEKALKRAEKTLKSIRNSEKVEQRKEINFNKRRNVIELMLQEKYNVISNDEIILVSAQVAKKQFESVDLLEKELNGLLNGKIHAIKEIREKTFHAFRNPKK